MHYPKQGCAVVTGGGSGLGRALCNDLARRGARVVIADIDSDGAEQTAELVRRAGGDALVVAMDVSEPKQFDALAEQAEAAFGPVELLANNAGVAVSGHFADVTLADWQWIMGINLWGVIHGCRAFVPGMQRRGRGHIINVASAAGLVSFPEMSPYNVTKAGVVALSETLFNEVRSSGVHVSVLCPTFFRTRIAESGRTAGGVEQRETVHKLMDRSKLQAPDVARMAVDGVLRGDLYVVPMRDGRMMWRAWRSSPEGTHRLLARGLRRIRDVFR